MPLYTTGTNIQPSTDFTPVLTAATPPSAVTYTKQMGIYRMVGNRVIFDIEIVTSSITKASGLNDALRITLPSTVGAGPTRIAFAQAENSIPVVVANGAEIVPGNNYLTLKQNQTTVGRLLDLTFALLTGIGILSNTITIKVSGSYESA